MKIVRFFTRDDLHNCYILTTSSFFLFFIYSPSLMRSLNNHLYICKKSVTYRQTITIMISKQIYEFTKIPPVEFKVFWTCQEHNDRFLVVRLHRPQLFNHNRSLHQHLQYPYVIIFVTWRTLCFSNSRLRVDELAWSKPSRLWKISSAQTLTVLTTIRGDFRSDKTCFTNHSFEIFRKMFTKWKPMGITVELWK